MTAVELIQRYVSSPAASPLSEEARLGNLLADLRRLGVAATLSACVALAVPGAFRDLQDREGLLFCPEKLERWLRARRAARGAAFPAPVSAATCPRAREVAVHINRPRQRRCV